jgi:N,N'-diacetyllegionaminate synthase
VTRTLIIAEAGVNHNGDMDLAKRLVDAAAAAGADVVKFQTFVADRLVTASAKKADYQVTTTGAAESQRAMLRRLELTREAHEQLIAHTRSRNIEFLSTAFDVESVDLLLELGLSTFKIPSGEITNTPYLRHIGRVAERVIISTGMATLGDIEAAIDVLETAGTPRTRITVLHCTTEYPTPMNEVNLRAMQSIHEAFAVDVGYSDHTRGIEVPIAAAALGASVIEKHFTLDRTLPGPDHQASLEPSELEAMVRGIRNIEIALGDGVKRLTPSEMRNKSIVRKSIVAARVIEHGEVLNESNLTTKRPATGLSPLLWDQVIGRVATRTYAADEQVEM